MGINIKILENFSCNKYKIWKIKQKLKNKQFLFAIIDLVGKFLEVATIKFSNYCKEQFLNTRGIFLKNRVATLKLKKTTLNEILHYSGAFRFF